MSRERSISGASLATPKGIWALRGGGGNFRIVTSFEYALHDVGPTVFSGAVFYSGEVATEVLRGYREACRDCPEELSTVVNLRAGAHYGGYCLGCCWTVMALLAAFGVMNLWAMAGLTAVMVMEKVTPIGPTFARVVGVASFALAVAVFWVPAIAPGLTGGGMTPI
ncbi:MAG: DUF2182 domain-containing protein [Streptosporangiaceae bacterium]